MVLCVNLRDEVTAFSPEESRQFHETPVKPSCVICHDRGKKRDDHNFIPYTSRATLMSVIVERAIDS